MKHVVSGERPDMVEACRTPLSQLMQICWAQDPKARPSAAEVVGELIKLQKQLDSKGKKTGPSRRQSATLPLPRPSLSPTDAPRSASSTTQSVRMNSLAVLEEAKSSVATNSTDRSMFMSIRSSRERRNKEKTVKRDDEFYSAQRKLRGIPKHKMNAGMVLLLHEQGSRASNAVAVAEEVAIEVVASAQELSRRCSG